MGLTPRREPQRPRLPQHARHCPVLEAGSASGFMVYAPLELRESYYVEYEGDGRYEFVHCLESPARIATPVFSVAIAMSLGAVGMMKQDVEFMGVPILSREGALDCHARVCRS